MQQVEPQIWLPWQEGSFHQEWRAVWGTWHWWMLGPDSSQPRPLTCKPTRPMASTCSHALHRLLHTRTQTHIETLEWHHTHTHTQQTYTKRLTQIEPDTYLVLCCYQKKRLHNKMHFSVCSKTKKDRKIQTILTSLLFLGVVFLMKDY